MDYTIENLVPTFAKHAEKYERQLIISIEEHKKHYPDLELPDHFNNSFNLAKALCVIATEIEKLKKVD